MTSTTRWNRFSPGSVVAVVVVSSLLLGLVALCCCVGEHAVAHGTARTAATIIDPGDDSPVDGDAGRSGEGCDRSADHPVAIVASATAITRDLAAAVALDPLRIDDGADRPIVAGGGPLARAPVSHLLCIMRT